MFMSGLGIPVARARGIFQIPEYLQKILQVPEIFQIPDF
jgi:hypothetical protein